MFLGMALVAALFFLLAVVFARFIGPLQNKGSRWVFLLLNFWNAATIGVSFEILDYTGRHGEIVGPLELCVYVLVYMVASLGGSFVVAAIHRCPHKTVEGSPVF